MSSTEASVVRFLAKEDYGRLLNELLATERAAAKLVAAYASELPLDSDAWAWLTIIQRDEARNCSILIHLLLEEGLQPSMTVSDAYDRGLAVRGWKARLRYLTRLQQWSAARIACGLSGIRSAIGRRSLTAMRDSLRVNIGVCEEQIEPWPGT
jgi:hypothetical protein